MRKSAALLLTVMLFTVGLASGAWATPTEDTNSSAGIESAFGLQAGDAWVSAYVQAYDSLEGDQASKIVAATIFVDGENLSLECFALSEDSIVSVDPALSGGSYRATLEGLCHDFLTEEALPFATSLDIVAVGTGATETQAGSYVDDGSRCVSKSRSRDGTAEGQLSFTVPKRGVDALGSVSDEQASFVSFATHCHPMNGNPPPHEH